jgi:hypothetical protein
MLCVIVLHVHGQGDIQDDVRVFYGDEFTGSGSVLTNGLGFGCRYGVRQDAFKKHIYEFQVASIRHPKEVRLVSDKGARYVYGKSNSIFSLLLSYGKQHEKFSKLDRGSVAVRYIRYGGVAFAGEKPYYYRDVSSDVDYKRFEELTAATGKAPFIIGFSELAMVPGVFAGAIINFEFSNKEYVIQALEFGIQLQIYARNVDIMSRNANQQFFPSFFISYRFGKVLSMM